MDIPDNTAQGAPALCTATPSGPDTISDSSEIEGIPSRPSSHLGFNRSPLVASTPSDALAVHSCLQNNPSKSSKSVGTAACTMTVSLSPHLLPLPESTAVDNGRGSSPSPCVDQMAETARSPAIHAVGDSMNKPSPVPRKATTSVSRLCFPFVTTSPRRKKTPAPPPPPRHKHSCFPTKLAPYEASRPAPIHERHNYRHRGHSRLALEHTKWLWSLRQDEWKGESADSGERVFTSILSEPVGGVHPTTHPGSSRTSDPKVTHGGPAPMSIHPRRGDISALRDPYCVEVDRSFNSLPTWTMSKTLWMHDLHLAVEKRRPRLKIILDDDMSDAESELETETSRSTSYSSLGEDSDTTLFDSETEFDAYDSERMSLKVRNFSSTSTSSFASPMSSPLPPRDYTIMASWPSTSFIEDALAHHCALNAKPAWTTNWYQRWEVLKGHANRWLDRKEEAGHFSPSNIVNTWRPLVNPGSGFS